MNKDWVIALEKKVAFQENLLAQLNDALVGQQKQLTVLEARFNLIKDQMERAELVKHRDEETPPPHY